MIVLGAISDTHIPDRVGELHPAIIPTFQRAGVTHIVHAGDICVPRVLNQLGAVAPVLAVRGNRDWLFFGKLPLLLAQQFEGVHVAIAHGHGGWVNYLREKVYHFRHGYHRERYKNYLLSAAPQADVIIFGHTHFPEIIRESGKLLINPGTASNLAGRIGLTPTVGIVRIDGTKNIEAEIKVL